jgi:hypothetical protein
VMLHADLLAALSAMPRARDQGGQSLPQGRLRRHCAGLLAAHSETAVDGSKIPVRGMDAGLAGLRANWSRAAVRRLRRKSRAAAGSAMMRRWLVP